MRLIDADNVKQYVLTEGFYCDTEADKETTAREIDKLFPTVDAIPVEWIEKWWRGHFTLADGYDYFMHYLGDMLDDWEKENEVD